VDNPPGLSVGGLALTGNNEDAVLDSNLDVVIAHARAIERNYGIFPIEAKFRGHEST